jgi:type VI secretion system protein VasG
VVETISARCKDVDSGARNADHIITGTVLTEISAQVLTRIADGHTVKGVTVGVDDKSQMTYVVD